jgi:GNAT superfamily N-acetyltransferase
MEALGDSFSISDDRGRINLRMVHDFLRKSYWSRDIPLKIFEKSIRHSLCFSVFDGPQQIGFARVISDYATFAYLADVFILEDYRGLGLSKRLMTYIRSHPELQGLRRWMLATRDAQGLYRQFGFKPLEFHDRIMEVTDPDIYTRSRAHESD